ncbi:MAG TPA: hypothetical protein VLD67_21590, partial [Vicinamibacterales bacterium]|nr:hypothetical protein [Vicinamibacterales bacterium]
YNRALGRRRSVGVAVGMCLILFGLMVLPLGTLVTRGSPQIRVAIVVGPVGEELTPVYHELAEMAAESATSAGATVSRAYSPDATPERVIEAVAGANIVIYFGHGTGFPNPYSDELNAELVNGWGLQGPAATGTHADSAAEGTLQYYGEAWLEENLRPAPGFVMIYSNACYAPGASEGGLPRPSEEEALAHVANYSRPILALGASAYFATDFYAGAAGLVSRLLADPSRPYGDVFRADPMFSAEALSTFPHPRAPAEIWLHRSPYFEGALDYWYAFAGDPSASIAAAAGAVVAAPVVAAAPAPPDALLVSGRASSYPAQPGYGTQPTAALPDALGGRPLTESGTVAVCADRCIIVKVVDSCPCFWGTPDQRVINLSHSAWEAVTDMPLAEGLIEVRVYRDGMIPPDEAPRQLYPEMPAVPSSAASA